jgi:hypothetical protein
MTDGMRLAPCLNCEAKGWIADGMGGWVRCLECNPEPAPKVRGNVLTFARGAKVKRGVVVDNDLPPAA